MVPRRWLSILSLTLSLGISLEFAEAQQFQVSKSELVLTLKHLPLGSFETKATDSLEASFEVKDSQIKLLGSSAKFLIAGLKSMVPLRDAHLHKKLEYEKYPYIELSNLSASTKDSSFTAQLKVRDTTAPIQGKISLDKDFTKMTVEFGSKMSTFGIPNPDFLGVGVKDDFEIVIQLESQAYNDWKF